MKIKTTILCAGILLLMNYALLAQNQGNIELVNATSANSLVQKHISINKEMNGIPGYRIQIFSDSGNNSRKNAMRSKAKFKMKNSDIKAYVVFEAPNYKVEVGNFVSRLQAERYLHQIKEFYPAAFIVLEPQMDIPDL
ncbi:MAG: SPOR domain-containing protein [Bacteroidales bacterium]|nr:SPOR domain-containing protein [Bacteroidales bacterium]